MKTNYLLPFFALIIGLACTTSSFAQQPAAVKVDSDAISGLGARNIGSAAMSGRISAVTGVREGQCLTLYVGSPPLAEPT